MIMMMKTNKGEKDEKNRRKSIEIIFRRIWKY